MYCMEGEYSAAFTLRIVMTRKRAIWVKMILFMRVFCEKIYLVSNSMFGLKRKSSEKEIESIVAYSLK